LHVHVIGLFLYAKTSCKNNVKDYVFDAVAGIKIMFLVAGLCVFTIVVTAASAVGIFVADHARVTFSILTCDCDISGRWWFIVSDLVFRLQRLINFLPGW